MFAKPFMLTGLLILNLVPLVGVFVFQWKSFDLIFLYWLENVIIGVFTLLRMLVRPYGHPLELILPLFLAPFFALHYGGFCWGHGTFVVSLFGPEHLDGVGLLTVALRVILDNGLLWAAGSLALIQVLDWARDIHTHGLGAQGVKTLMVAPYRRIVVLHIAILAAGFLLSALHDPMIGLLALIAVKTASDVWHWRKDDNAAADGRDEATTSLAELDPETLAKLEAEYPEPVIKVNGVEHRYESYAALKASKHYRMMQALLRLIGGGKQLKAIDAYFDHRIRTEASD